jgi:hypothetical protein
MIINIFQGHIVLPPSYLTDEGEGAGSIEQPAPEDHGGPPAPTWGVVKVQVS